MTTEQSLRSWSMEQLCCTGRAGSLRVMLTMLLFTNLFGVAWGQIDLDLIDGRPRIPLEPVRQGVINDIDAQFNAGAQTAGEGGATLKTDPELESLLEKANRYKEDGNYRVATQFWQAVLERSGDALFSSDDKTYYSLVQRVEQILAELPQDGLESYRIIADANAKEILAAAGDPFDVLALSQIVRQYFISSLGDDAALTLSSIYLDRFDFVGAYRLLQKIVQQYPDPSVSMRDVHYRLALCEGYFGNGDAANESLERARLLGTGAETGLDATVRESIAKLRSASIVDNVGSNWLLPLGDRRRRGVMPSVPDAAFGPQMEAVWQYYFEPSKQFNWADYKQPEVIIGGTQSVDGTITNVEKSLVKSWRSKNWNPTGQLLVNNDKIYFKTPVDLIAWNANAKDDRVVWRPMRRNAFEVDEFTRLLVMYRRNWNRGRMRQVVNTNSPYASNEIQLFGDQIAAQMSIQDGTLYNIEGRPFDTRINMNSLPQTSHWNASPRRSRTNFLVAYDAESGQFRWSLPKIEEEIPTNADAVANPDLEITESPWLRSGGFMAAPISFRGLVIAPVNQGGAISIYAFDPEQEGKTVWSSFLCDEPETGAYAWSPVNLSIDGSDLFVTCGLGVVFVLDPSTGLVRFAKRYERQGTEHKLLRQYGKNQNHLKFNGWTSDTVIPYGQQMICFRSDAQNILALNRNTGKLMWFSSMQPLSHKVEYVLGIYNGILYVAGPGTIIGYELDGDGRIILEGEALFDGKKSYGRGMLTAAGIYLPVEDSIYKISLTPDDFERPVVLGIARVELGTEAPVGNLYSDGEKIWVHGANRLYALGVKQGTKSDNEDDQ